MISNPTSLTPSLGNSSELVQTGLTYNSFTENCGFSMFRVHAMFNAANKLTKAALIDAKKHGVNSEYGFAAMFKMTEALPTVTAVLDDIYN